jgi:hypothetical protein
MFGEEKKLKILKDTNPTLLPPLSGEGGERLSYTKTDKLITALYMVTDIIDKDEPLRNKLRTLGTGIISDMHLIRQNNVGPTLSFMGNKISEVMSFLDLASAVNIISEMNYNILKKEFSELNNSILESAGKATLVSKQINLAEFFLENSSSPFRGGFEERFPKNSSHPNPLLNKERGNAIGHYNSTSIGVQKGSTLLKALSGVKIMSNTKTNHGAVVFDALKRQRREAIVAIIKNINGGATIKDIKDKAKANLEKFNVLITCSEKTLQRELISMVKDNVLDKTGEKRWSKYFLKN